MLSLSTVSGTGLNGTEVIATFCSIYYFLSSRVLDFLDIHVLRKENVKVQSNLVISNSQGKRKIDSLKF